VTAAVLTRIGRITLLVVVWSSELTLPAAVLVELIDVMVSTGSMAFFVAAMTACVDPSSGSRNNCSVKARVQVDPCQGISESPSDYNIERVW
jgi:hypothetical protein